MDFWDLRHIPDQAKPFLPLLSGRIVCRGLAAILFYVPGQQKLFF